MPSLAVEVMLEKQLTIGEMLKRRALYSPDLEALIGPTKRITFKEFNQLTNQLSYYFLKIGIKSGDRVALLFSTDVYFSLFYYALAKVGAITVGLNWRHTGHELGFIIQDADPKVLFYEHLFEETLQQCPILPSKTIQAITNFDFDPYFWQEIKHYPTDDFPIEVDIDHPLSIIYTSGTTGKPKGVVITHRNIYNAAINNAFFLQKQTGDRLLYITPLCHITGMGMLAYQAHVGCTYVFMPQFHPEKYIQLLEHENITHAFLVPSLLKLLYPLFEQNTYNLSSLKEILSGGSSVPKQIIKQYYSLGYAITHIYASTESLFVSIWKTNMGLENANTVGKPVLCDIKIVDPDTCKELPVGEIGEVTIQSEMLFKEYWNNKNETQKKLRKGWFYTGDAGKITKNGFLQLVGRYKDIITFSGGEKIFPAEVEEVIKELPDVQEVAVVGMNDKLWNQVPVAFVVKKEKSPLTETEIFEYVHSKLAKYKLRGVTFIDELPKNSIGKVLKSQLREMKYPTNDS